MGLEATWTFSWLSSRESELAVQWISHKLTDDFFSIISHGQASHPSMNFNITKLLCYSGFQRSGHKGTEGTR